MFFYITLRILGRTIILWPVAVILAFLFFSTAIIVSMFTVETWTEYKKRVRMSAQMFGNILLNRR